MFTGAKDDLADTYRMVHGGPGQLTDPIRERSIGLRPSDLGFSALIRTVDTDVRPAEVSVEAPSIDDILIRIAKETHIAREGDQR